MRQVIDMNKFAGAEVVIQNYLDGALADYENGDVENDSLIESCIYTLKFIYSHCNPWLLLGSIKDYEERYLKAKEQRK